VISDLFSTKLLKWYKTNKRDLPWRKTNDAYTIWISEIILQQTRVDQGLSYFNKFLNQYPNIKLLAAASEQEVLNLWQGLGYYSRARNLHFTAKYISNQLNGKFPEEYTDILGLKGVGPYTAAAIASFAFNKAYPVIDGNVIRVVSRYCGIHEAVDQSDTMGKLKSRVNLLFDKNNPAAFNQAIMEFGALHCIPANPDCYNCIFKLDCQANAQNLVSKIPFKSKKIVKKHRYINYVVLVKNGQLILKKRNDSDIWKNLYDFPSSEQKDIKSMNRSVEKEIQIILKDLKTEFIEKSSWKKQILTHRIIHARFWKYQIEKNQKINNSEWQLVSKNMLKKYPVPKLIEQYINDL